MKWFLYRATTGRDSTTHALELAWHLLTDLRPAPSTAFSWDAVVAPAQRQTRGSLAESDKVDRQTQLRRILWSAFLVLWASQLSRLFHPKNNAEKSVKNILIVSEQCENDNETSRPQCIALVIWDLLLFLRSK